jgi:Uma2 family endonuclease
MAAAPETFQPPHYITIAEYLKIEDETGLRHEWVNGTVRAMAGAAPGHVTIVSNIVRRLGNQLEGKSCQPWSNDIRVRIPISGQRYFPDVVVACPPHEWDEEIPHTLLNPRVVIEVLSPSTGDIDRGEKLRAYFRLPSLTDYVLVASQEMYVTHLHRECDGDWRIHIADQSEDFLDLKAIECRISLPEIYERLNFGGQPEQN